MRNEQKDIAELGPIGIVREAFKLLWTHAKHFLLIQLTLMLPVLILILACQNFFLAYLPEITPDVHVAPISARRGFHLLSLNEQVAFVSDPELNPFPDLETVFLTLLITIAGAILGFVFRAAYGLSMSAVLLSVGLIYSGKTISFVDVLRSAIPRLWMRLVVTIFYVALITTSMALCQLVLIVILHFTFQPVYTSFIILATVVIFLVTICVEIVFMLAVGVTILEEDYGWAAFKRGRNLVKGKIRTAVLFQAVWLIPSVITGLFQRALQLQIQGDRTWNVAIIVLVSLVYIAWVTFEGVLKKLCAGVQYVSFKAYHNESINCKVGTDDGYEAIRGDMDPEGRT